MELEQCRICRPGGLSLTERLIQAAALPPGAKVLDAGCGQGATVLYLKERFGYQAYGMDKAPSVCYDPDYFYFGDFLKDTPPEGPFDAVIFECSLSKMEPPEDALKNARDILKDEGVLLISDMYARGEEARLIGSLGRLEHAERIRNRVNASGFDEFLFEDASRELMNYWAQMVFDGERSQLSEELTLQMDSLKRIRCGYFLMAAKKRRIP